MASPGGGTKNLDTVHVKTLAEIRKEKVGAFMAKTPTGWRCLT